MKCPHCGQEHPNEYMFCPLTAKSLTPQLKACRNESCKEYGKYTLPLDAIFCPCCGKPLEALGGDTHTRDFYITMAEVLNKIETGLLSLSDDKMKKLGKRIQSANIDWDTLIHEEKSGNGTKAAYSALLKTMCQRR